MVDTSIAGTSFRCYRDIIGLPRCGGPAALWRQISKEKEVTGIIADNHIL
jgi:hypothetical protein